MDTTIHVSSKLWVENFMLYVARFRVIELGRKDTLVSRKILP